MALIWSAENFALNAAQLDGIFATLNSRTSWPMQLFLQEEYCLQL